MEACDFSQTAVDLANTHEMTKSAKITVRQLDLVKDAFPFSYFGASYGCLIFVLSAIRPEEHFSVLSKVFEALEPGGILYFRDYGEFDMVRLRYASKKKYRVDEKLYIRPDSTLTYFFNKTELEELFIKVGFEIKLSREQKKCIANRKRNLKMYRIFHQLRLVKPKEL